MAQEIIVKFEADVDEFRKDLTKLKKQLKGFKDGAKETEESAEKLGNKLSGGISKKIAGFGAALLGAFAIQSVVRGAISSIVEFEKAIASLAAITGQSGDDLIFLKDQAIKMGAASGLGAAATAKAFELIGSAKPELLASGEALASVTEQAILLSQASGLDLVSSATAVTTALNQFGLGAEEANRAVNVLAAGAKEGASAIPATAEALSNFGAVASGANVTLEESVALVQVLAEKQITASVAGNNLKNIILKLQTAGKGFSTGQFVLNEALEQTKAEFAAIDDPVKRATEETKLFGLESITSAKILLRNVDGFNRLTDSVTATNVATKQAELNTGTLAFKTEQFQATYEAMVLGIEDGSGAFGELAKTVVDLGTEILSLIAGVEKSGEALKPNERELRETALTVISLVKALSVLTVGIAGYAAGTKIATALSAAHAAITKLITASTKGATIAQRAYNVAIAANPLGIIIALLATAGAAFLAYSSSVDEAADSDIEFVSASEKARRELQLQAAALDRATQTKIKLALIKSKPLFDFTTGDLEKQLEIFIVQFERAERAQRGAAEGGRALTAQQKGILALSKRSIEAIKTELKARKDALDALRDSTTVEKDLIKELQAELKLVKDRTAGSEDLIKARNKEAAGIETEIKRLQDLGKAVEQKDAKVKKGFDDFDAEQKAKDELQKLSIQAILDDEKVAFDEKKKLLDREAELIIRNSELGPEQKALELEKIKQLLTDARDSNNESEQLQKDKESEDRKTKNDAILSGATEVGAAVLDLQQAQNDRAADAAIQSLEKRLESNLISEEEFEAARGKILTEQAEKTKALAVTQSIINTALGITNALATGGPAAPVLAIAAGIAGGIQTAIIASEPIPQFATGGKIGGKDHSQGGTVIEAEKDEFMVNKKDARKNGNLLEHLNVGALDSYIQQKYVVPALMKQKAKLASVSDERMVSSMSIAMQGNNWKGSNLMDSDKATRRVLQEISDKLDDNTQKQRYHY